MSEQGRADMRSIVGCLDGDGEMATLITRRYFQMVVSWVEEDGNSAGDPLLDDGIATIADRGPR